MKVKEFFKRWGEGIKTLSPAYQLKSRIIGIIGAIFGLTLGFVFLSLKGNWYFIIAGVFFIYLQVLDLISTLQQYEQAKNVEIFMQGGGLKNENKNE